MLFGFVLVFMMVVLGVGLAVALGKVEVPPEKQNTYFTLAVTAAILLSLLALILPRDKWPEWLRQKMPKRA